MASKYLRQALISQSLPRNTRPRSDSTSSIRHVVFLSPLAPDVKIFRVGELAGPYSHSLVLGIVARRLRTLGLSCCRPAEVVNRSNDGRFRAHSYQVELLFYRLGCLQRDRSVPDLRPRNSCDPDLTLTTPREKPFQLMSMWEVWLYWRGWSFR